MAEEAPSIWLLVFVQCLSAISDFLGQRANRVHFGFNRKKMMISIPIVSSIQVFVLLLIAEYTLPRSISSSIYKAGHKIQCYQEVDYDNTRSAEFCEEHADMCTEVQCPPGGPVEMVRAIYFHPELLLNGFLNIIYYMSTFALYNDPLGIVLVVLASLSASFLLPVVNAMLGSPEITHSIPLSLFLLGVVGAVLSVIDLSGRKGGKAAEVEEEALISDADDPDPWWKRFKPRGRNVIPFVVQSLVEAVWIISQGIFNSHSRINVLTYTSIDQILLPVYIYSALILMEKFAPKMGDISFRPEYNLPFTVLLKEVLHDSPWVTLFMYRLLANTRAIFYYYFAVTYDISIVYFQLTLIRIVISWAASLTITVAYPKLLMITEDEKKRTMSRPHLVLKATGTLILCVVIYLLGNQ